LKFHILDGDVVADLEAIYGRDETWRTTTKGEDVLPFSMALPYSIFLEEKM
jgi:hypothetical protein